MTVSIEVPRVPPKSITQAPHGQWEPHWSSRDARAMRERCAKGTFEPPSLFENFWAALSFRNIASTPKRLPSKTHKTHNVPRHVVFQSYVNDQSSPQKNDARQHVCAPNGMRDLRMKQYDQKDPRREPSKTLQNTMLWERVCLKAMLITNRPNKKSMRDCMFALPMWRATCVWSNMTKEIQTGNLQKHC